MRRSLVSIDRGTLRDTSWFNAQPDGMVYIGRIAYGWKGEMPPNTSYTIREGTIGIAHNAFARTQLTSVTIPNSVTHIGGGAFWNTQLTSVTIPDSVLFIDGLAFSETPLTSVTIPDSVTHIGRSAFYGTNLDEASRVRISEINPYALVRL